MTLIVLSCCVSTIKPSYGSYERVYVNTMAWLFPPDYIILKSPERIFERYWPWPIDWSVGTWDIIGDTLKMYTRAEYGITDMRYFHEVNDSDYITITTITKSYIIKEDSLIDVTNYEAIGEPILTPIDKFKAL